MDKLETDRVFEDLLNSQSLETFNEYLKLDKETSRRAIKIQ